jgi:hypothetical protein
MKILFNVTKHIAKANIFTRVIGLTINLTNALFIET